MLVSAGSLSAQTDRTWIGTNGNWTTAGNWSGGAPGNNTTANRAVFSASTGGTVTIDSSRSVNGIQFSNTAGTYTLGKPTNGAVTLTLGSGGISQLGNNTQSFTNGNLTVALSTGATFTVGNAGNLTMSNAAVAIGGNTLTLNASSTGVGSISGPITGTSAGAVVKTGTGLWILSGANTYTGGTTVAAGTLAIASTGSLGSTGALTINGGTLSLSNAAQTIATFRGTGGTLDLSGSTTLTITQGSDQTFAGNTTGGGGLVKTGASALTLSGTNTYTGGTTLANGTLIITSGSSLASTGALTINGGTLSLNNSSQTIGTFRGTGGTLALNGTTLTITQGSNQSYTGAVTGTGALIKDGSSTLTLSGTTSYTGGTTVNAGTLATGTNQLSSSGAVTINGGTLDINNTSQTVASLSGTGGTLDLGTGNTFTVNQTGNTTFGGAITGAGTFMKAGSGTLTLGGAGSNTGGTNVAAGTLVVSSTGSLSSTGTVTISGGTLSLNNASQTIGTLSGYGATSTLGLGTGTTLTITQGSDQYVTTNIVGDGALIKAGASTLTINGTHTYTGGTTVNSGTLAIASGATMASTGAYTIAGGTLSFNSSQTLGTIQGTAGTLSLASGGTYTVSQGSDQTLTSVLTGAGAFIKSGSATLTLAGSNTHTGSVTVLNGGLAVASGSNLGNNTVLTVDGGTLTLNNTSQTVSNFSGTGGTVVLGSGHTLTVNQSNNFTYSGNITGAGGLVKAGTNTLTLAGTNTHTGGTTLSAGTVIVSSGASLSGLGALTLSPSTTLQLNNGAQTVGTLSGTGGTIALGTTTLTVTQGSNATYAGLLTGSGNFTKTGSSTLTLSGNNTSFTGAVSLLGGTTVIAADNAFGTGTLGTTVANGAALQIDGGRLTTSNGLLTLSGTGTGSGALISTGGNNRWNGNITLAGDTLIDTASTGYLALGTTSPAFSRPLNDPTHTPPTDTHRLNIGSNTLTISGNTSAGDNRAVYINSRITGNGNMVIDMDGASETVRLTANMNEFTGTTTINKGTLSLATLGNFVPGDTVNPNYFGINGPVVIGNNLDASGSAILSVQAGTAYSEIMNYNTSVTLNKSGVWNQLATQSIGNITFSGGKIELGDTGGIALGTISGNTAVGGVVTVAASDQTAYITGNLANATATHFLDLTVHKTDAGIPNTTGTFNVVGTGNFNRSDLTIQTRVYHGNLTLNGNGTLTLTNNNAYEGVTTVNGGVLAIQHNRALGDGDGGSVAASTLVNSGGTLQMFSNSTIGDLVVANERLRLNGDGYTTGAGALQNLNGNNTWAGTIDVITNSRIQSLAGLLTLSGSITSSTNANVTFGGSGNTTVSGAIGTGSSGSVTKDGTGTLILSGANTYGGNTTITAGVVSVQSASALGSAGTGTYLTGGEIQISNDSVGGSGFSVNAEPTYLTGTGVSGAGALRNVAGNNTYGGTVYATGNTLVTSNNGLNFTMSGGTSSSGAQMTFGHSSYSGNITISGNMANSGSEVLKNGSGNLAINGSTANTGRIGLNAGTMSVGGTTTLTATEIDTALGTTLTMASGGQITINAAAGSTSTIAGTMTNSAGTLTFNGADVTSRLVFDHAVGFNAANMNLTLNGGTVQFTGGGDFGFGKISFTANTVLDFSNFGGTWLSSAQLDIAAGVTVTVVNWKAVADNAAASTVWYLQSSMGSGTGGVLMANGGGNQTLGGTDLVGGTPLSQIVFADYNGMSTTWVSGNHDGWFNHEIRPTPEPATYGAIFLSGCLSLLGYRRWRRSKQG